MGRYLFQRIIALGITLFIILSIAFLLVRLMPGSIYDEADITKEAETVLRAKYHLDDPMIVQYGYYLQGLSHGDWGTSVALQPGAPVYEIIKHKVPISLRINLISLFAAIPIGMIAGTIAAIKKNTFVDHIISVMVIIFISVPSFIFASLLQYVLAFKWEAFPMIYDSASATNMEFFMSMFLPILALMFSPIAKVARYLRAELGEVMNSEFLMLARTKGLTYSQSIVRHGMRNSFIPLANIVIPMFATIMGGSLVVENIFAVPGMGGLMIDAINSSDHYVTIAILVFYSLISLVTMLVVDVSYGIIDPRIRVGGRK